MLPELLAYPVLLAAMIGVLRVGRGEKSRVFEWVRLLTLATLVGMIVAIQVKLIVAGLVDSPFTLAAGSVSIAGVVLLVGLHVFERQGGSEALLASSTNRPSAR